MNYLDIYEKFRIDKGIKYDLFVMLMKEQAQEILDKIKNPPVVRRSTLIYNDIDRRVRDQISDMIQDQYIGD